ncbi:MAG TPA: NADH-quinone oxidoreductase subunit C [Bacteroidales bacterium]|nr:NADH-quinone oxidoreductase subunit C [Lentimicrobiaceae bacterium]HOI00417.1 NADH-quinone oxidoreductase subunit C [Bacteroidales bacterium]
MKTDKHSDFIQARFSGNILDIEQIHPKRVTIAINADIIRELAGFLYQELGLRFIIASAMQTKAGIEIYYHFSDDTNGYIYHIHVTLPATQPEIDSLALLFSGANWIEREMHEILGIVFRGHPEPEKLISEGNWAEGVYPYRNDQ